MCFSLVSFWFENCCGFNFTWRKRLPISWFSSKTLNRIGSPFGCVTYSICRLYNNRWKLNRSDIILNLGILPIRPKIAYPISMHICIQYTHMHEVWKPLPQALYIHLIYLNTHFCVCVEVKEITCRRTFTSKIC